MSPNNIIATHAIVGWTTIQPTDEPHHLLQSQEVPAYRLTNSHGEVIGSNSVYSFGDDSFVAVAGWPVWEDAEMAKIPEAEMRIKNVQDWLGANLPDHADALGGLATDSASFVAVEALLEKVGKRPASPSEYAGMPVPSMAEIQQMQAAVDDNGQRKMQDPAYAAKVRGLMEYHVGRG